MNRPLRLKTGIIGFIFILAAQPLSLGNIAQAQSPIVFMTVDVASQSIPLQSRLVRFNAGVETFSVNANAASAFQGVTPLGNELLVADYVNEAIQRFSQSGAYLGQFAPFMNPTFLESDSSGNVYTNPSSLPGSPGVTRFNSAGSVTQVYTHASLGSPRGVDADAAGNVYVASSGATTSILKFAANGTFLNSVPLSFSGYDLSIDEVGQRLYLANELASAIGVFDISGATPTPLGSIATLAGSRITGVHYSPSSNTVLAVSGGGIGFVPRGLEYSLGGTLLKQYFAANTFEAFDITTIPVPEPSSGLLVTVGLLISGLGLRSRNR